MIPKKLELKNFLSYGPQLQTVDFGHYPLICLSGKNGHGKSALLDAMTWAVWGQARKTSGVAKADAHLMHLGQTQMMVCFEFEFNGEMYRIKREYAKTYGKPLATVEFGIVDAGTNQYRSLTDKTIRATQEKIEDTIGLNYDAFINSAFLKQGQSNEFSKKSPKERKEIIGHILGLDQFENLRKKAMETARNLGVKKTVQAQQHETTLKELEKKPELLNRLTLTDEELKKVNTSGQAVNERHKALSLEKSAFAKKEQEAALLQQQHQALTKQKNEYESELKQLITDWRATHKMLRTISDKKLIEKQLNELSSRLEDHQKRLANQFTLRAATKTS